MKSSYLESDVQLLLKDISGMVKPMSTEERERKIQSGTHYCEMLPLEYEPTPQYIKVYEHALAVFSKATADAVVSVSTKIWEKKGANVVLVSLARAGTPIGILIKRYLRKRYGIEVMHYSISIIRGRGIDKNAISFILKKHKAQNILFVDGWTGKGAILGELKKQLESFPGIHAELAVLSDPANLTGICGTHEDILIPSSCLNCTVSGLISRTFLREDIIGAKDFHGAVYYKELADQDRTYEFINKIESQFSCRDNWDKDNSNKEASTAHFQLTGIEEVVRIADQYGIDDINRIKPGIGETTRVLLRRVPWKVLVANQYKESFELAHIFQLAQEKKVNIEYVDLIHYKCCGLIKKLADI